MLCTDFFVKLGHIGICHDPTDLTVQLRDAYDFLGLLSSKASLRQKCTNYSMRCRKATAPREFFNKHRVLNVRGKLYFREVVLKEVRK